MRDSEPHNQRRTDTHSASSFPSSKTSRKACDWPVSSQVWKAEEGARRGNLWQTPSVPTQISQTLHLPTASICIPVPAGFISQYHVKMLCVYEWQARSSGEFSVPRNRPQPKTIWNWCINLQLPCSLGRVILRYVVCTVSQSFPTAQ